ncbi:hypothetical protein DER44DRAFT_843718 [Fusarium oxysporum]|nr:hypothetical protein DER44DRAFT_843718 [Fusarium oxysporum]
MAQKPSLIFVPGAWHSPECWGKIMSAMEAKEFKCIPVALPTNQSTSTDVNYSHDVKAVADAIAGETSQGLDVVLLVHSYSGPVGQSAMRGFTNNSADTDGKTGRVIGLFNVATGFVREGASFLDALGGKPLPTCEADYENNLMVIVVDPIDMMYHDLPAEEADYWVGKLSKHALTGSTEGYEATYEGWRDVPVWQVMTKDDRAYPYEAQKMLVRGAEKLGADITKRLIDITSPAVSLHTFNGSGNNGTFWTTSQDGVIWTMVNCLDDAMSTPPSETFEPSTSPAVAVYQDTLYDVWNSSAANGTLRYTYVNKATNSFVQPKNLTAGGLSIRSQTSPAMVEFNGLLYLFFNGSGLNGTWMTTFNGNVWADVTLPFLSDDKRVLTLLWYGSGSNGTWYTTTTNGITWSNQVGLNDGQVLMAGSSPCGIDYHGRPYIFFVGGDGNLWNYNGYSLAMDAFLKGNDFAFVAQDDTTVKYLEAQFPNGSVIIQNPSSSPNITQSANPRNQTVAGNANWINLWHYFYNGSPSAIPREAVSLLALATLAFNLNYLISINTDCQMRFSPRLIFRRIPRTKAKS